MHACNHSVLRNHTGGVVILFSCALYMIGLRGVRLTVLLDEHWSFKNSLSPKYIINFK